MLINTHRTAAVTVSNLTITAAAAAAAAAAAVSSGISEDGGEDSNDGDHPLSAGSSAGQATGWLQWDLQALGNVSTSQVATLNGRALEILNTTASTTSGGGGGAWQLPDLSGRSVAAGSAVTIAPASYSFLALVGANAAACKGDDEQQPQQQQQQQQHQQCGAGSFEKGEKLGTDTLSSFTNASTAESCCELCTAEPRCVVFSFADKGKMGTLCNLEGKLGERRSKPGYISAVVRPGPSPGPPPHPLGPPAPGPAPGPGPDPERVAEYKRRVGLVQRGAPLAFGAVAQTQQQQHGGGPAAPLQIGDLFELSVNLSATFDNPYNASEVALDANFTVITSGTDDEEQTEQGAASYSYAVPGFFYTPFR